MAFTPMPNIKMMGFSVTGDVAGYTFYTTRRRQMVCYPQAPPLSPASPDQAAIRRVMKNTKLIWRGQSPEFRQLWNSTAARAGLTMAGFALLFTWYMKQDRSIFETIKQQTSIDLLATIAT